MKNNYKKFLASWWQCWSLSFMFLYGCKLVCMWVCGVYLCSACMCGVCGYACSVSLYVSQGWEPAWACMCMCVCVCLHVCVCMCVCAHVHACMCICAPGCVCECVRTHVHTRKWINAYLIFLILCFSMSLFLVLYVPWAVTHTHTHSLSLSLSPSPSLSLSLTHTHTCTNAYPLIPTPHTFTQIALLTSPNSFRGGKKMQKSLFKGGFDIAHVGNDLFVWKEHSLTRTPFIL